VAAPSAFDEELEGLTPLIEQTIRRYRLFVDEDYLEDLRQVARVAAYEAVATYDPARRATLLTYAFPRIRGAILHALRAYRRDHTGMTSLDEPLEETDLIGIALPSDGQGRETWTAEGFRDVIEREELAITFRQLSITDQEILACHYGAQETDAEIAARFHMNVSAARKRRQRAVQWLAEHVQA
jgi:RNA polymerase sigma factor (sigma-70 family)